jgi:periodic tryptophan protein 1
MQVHWKCTVRIFFVGKFGILKFYHFAVYNEDEGALYVHHDILLPSFPLCFEWLDYEPNAPKGNYCAIGSMSPVIEVWDLDIINCIEAAFSLGKVPSAKNNRPRVGHRDAVLSLAWNKNFETCSSKWFS